MSNAVPEASPNPHLLFRRRQVVHITAAAAAGMFAAGYLVNEIARDDDVLTWLARAGATVAVVTLYISVTQVRLAHQMARFDARTQEHLEAIEQRLESRLRDAMFAEGYVLGVMRRPPDDGGDGPHLHGV